MKTIAFILLTAVILSFAACSGIPFIIEKYEPQAVTANPIGSKVGTAPCSPTGIQEAANNAGITRIATVDIKTVYDGKTKTTTQMYVVSGE
ncbi:MAG: TRL-like family protein [Treponema sp.]|nr:TRL-like family protein [Treponema sp.]